jgi:hypothetical protein
MAEEAPCATMHAWCMYDACMSGTIQVRNVPPDVHRALTKAAKNAGMSLNNYLLSQLARIAKQAHNAEIFGRSDHIPGRRPTSEEIVADIRAMREER